MEKGAERPDEIVLCSECFRDKGLSFDALALGQPSDCLCPQCGSQAGHKLTRADGLHLAHRFFVAGTIHRTEYGGAPMVQFNDRAGDSDDFGERLRPDVRTLGQALGIRFFCYGPRLWMVGEVEPLKELLETQTQGQVIRRIVERYPLVELGPDAHFYRVRKNPEEPAEPLHYDSPPDSDGGHGRLDSKDVPILYASPDLELCLHECRITAEDQVYVATLSPARDIKLLDLTHILDEDGTEFESLDLALHMLFLAPGHAYEVTREIAKGVRGAGYDGLIFPSYFSLLRTGSLPFETAFGISIRKLDSLRHHAEAQTVPNLALFGRPVRDGLVNVDGINRVVIRRAAYDFHFGPAEV
jgi:hypothetical protein